MKSVCVGLQAWLTVTLGLIIPSASPCPEPALGVLCFSCLLHSLSFVSLPAVLAGGTPSPCLCKEVHLGQFKLSGRELWSLSRAFLPKGVGEGYVNSALFFPWLCPLPACTVFPIPSSCVSCPWANMSTAALHRPLTASPPSQELLRHSLAACSISPHHVALAYTHLFLPQDPLLLCAFSLILWSPNVWPSLGTLQHSDQSPPALSSVDPGAADRPCPKQSCPGACLSHWVRECALACGFCSQGTTHLPEQQINTNSLFLQFMSKAEQCFQAGPLTARASSRPEPYVSKSVIKFQSFFCITLCSSSS